MREFVNGWTMAGVFGRILLDLVFTAGLVWHLFEYWRLLKAENAKKKRSRV